MDASLVIMAAGIGSRFGGVKQIEHMGPHGEILMDYSIYDAVRVGFNKVVVITRADILEDVRALVDRVRPTVSRMGNVTFSYVLQDESTIPSFYKMPPERKKPMGTVHAVLTAKDAVREPFLVINADDYYGGPMYDAMYECIKGLDERHGAMAAYRLENTLSKNGGLTRGICGVKDGFLSSVTETYGIGVDEKGVITDRDGNVLNGKSVASMNVWGFTPEIFPHLERYFEDFLKALPKEDIKSECLLPTFVDVMIKGGYSVKAADFDAAWLGVTTRDDVPPMVEALKNMDYPPLV